MLLHNKRRRAKRARKFFKCFTPFASFKCFFTIEFFFTSLKSGGGGAGPLAPRFLRPCIRGPRTPCIHHVHVYNYKHCIYYKTTINLIFNISLPKYKNLFSINKIVPDVTKTCTYTCSFCSAILLHCPPNASYFLMPVK